MHNLADNRYLFSIDDTTNAISNSLLDSTEIREGRKLGLGESESSTRSCVVGGSPTTTWLLVEQRKGIEGLSTTTTTPSDAWKAGKLGLLETTE